MATVLKYDEAIATAWLHDVIEDQAADTIYLECNFGPVVTGGVIWLSDLEIGNRESRKRQSRERLARAPGWVQTIKVADLISNTSSIVKHDPKFAPVYLDENRLLLDAMKDADHRLVSIARAQCEVSL